VRCGRPDTNQFRHVRLSRPRTTELTPLSPRERREYQRGIRRHDSRRRCASPRERARPTRSPISTRTRWGSKRRRTCSPRDETPNLFVFEYVLERADADRGIVVERRRRRVGSTSKSTRPRSPVSVRRTRRTPAGLSSGTARPRTPIDGRDAHGTHRRTPRYGSTARVVRTTRASVTQPHGERCCIVNESQTGTQSSRPEFRSVNANRTGAGEWYSERGRRVSDARAHCGEPGPAAADGRRGRHRIEASSKAARLSHGPRRLSGVAVARRRSSAGSPLPRPP